MNNGTTLIIACLIAVAGCGLPKQPGIADQPVSKVPAMVTLSGLDHTYDGSSKTAEASTDPAGLGVKITYDGGARAPVNAGTYRVEAVVRDANYEGSAGATMTIAKAPQTITFNALAARTFGDKPFDLDGTASSGLKPAYESSDPAVAAISGKRLKITGAGFATITASQGGDRNHLPAEPVKQTLTVNKAPATVTLSGLEQTYDGLRQKRQKSRHRRKV